MVHDSIGVMLTSTGCNPCCGGTVPCVWLRRRILPCSTPVVQLASLVHPLLFGDAFSAATFALRRRYCRPILG